MRGGAKVGVVSLVCLCCCWWWCGVSGGSEGAVWCAVGPTLMALCCRAALHLHPMHFLCPASMMHCREEWGVREDLHQVSVRWW